MPRSWLQSAQLGLQGSDAPIELALGAQREEVRAQVRPREAPELALAEEAVAITRRSRDPAPYRAASELYAGDLLRRYMPEPLRV